MKRGKYACALLCALLSLVFGTAVAKAQTTPADSGRVRVAWATFNVRYDNPGDKLNSWKYRRDTVCGFIRARGLDIVGMQEVLHNQLEDLKAGLPGYAAVGVGRDDGKQAGEYSPLFYRTDKFELLDSSTFWLSQYPDSAGFIGWDGACTRIATWAKLRDRATGKVRCSWPLIRISTMSVLRRGGRAPCSSSAASVKSWATARLSSPATSTLTTVLRPTKR